MKEAAYSHKYHSISINFNNFYYLFCKVIVLLTPAILQTPSAVKVFKTTIVVNGSTKTIAVSM